MARLIGGRSRVLQGATWLPVPRNRSRTVTYLWIVRHGRSDLKPRSRLQRSHWMSAPSVTRQATGITTRHARALVVTFFVAGVLTWIGWTWWTVRQFRVAMTRVDTAMGAGRFGAAARDLERILARNPDSGEAAYVLGICEQARGRNEPADQAWGAGRAEILVSSCRAVLARLRLFHDTGRLASAERLILDAAKDPRNDRTDLLVLLVPVFSETGRSDEAARLIEDRWEDLKQRGEATPEQSIKLVRLHIELTWTAPSVENLRVYLDQASRLAPNDDRVWLGRASLALRTGDLDGAKRWLDACLRRRPDDVPVWRARLNWAMATKQVGAVQEAARRLSAAEWTPVQNHRLSAWLSGQRGDAAAERVELERLIAEAPADLTALDRLTQLAEKVGETARAAESAHKKAEVDAVRARYLRLNDRAQVMRDAEELALLAERLGSPFQSRVFRSLAIAENN